MTVPCQQENRITRIENKVDKLVDVVADVASSVRTLTTKIDTVVDTVHEHERTLKGSNGGLGVVAKVANSVDLLDELNNAMRGEKDKPGFIASISQMNTKIERWEANMTWLTRSVISVLIAGAIGAIVFLIQLYPALQSMK